MFRAETASLRVFPDVWKDVVSVRAQAPVSNVNFLNGFFWVRN